MMMMMLQLASAVDRVPLCIAVQCRPASACLKNGHSALRVLRGSFRPKGIIPHILSTSALRAKQRTRPKPKLHIPPHWLYSTSNVRISARATRSLDDAWQAHTRPEGTQRVEYSTSLRNSRMPLASQARR